jgi:hypothetical protein
LEVNHLAAFSQPFEALVIQVKLKASGVTDVEPKT